METDIAGAETEAKELTCIKCSHTWQVKERVIRRQRLTACPKCTAYNSTARAVAKPAAPTT